jgi:hypothetical protein
VKIAWTQWGTGTLVQIGIGFDNEEVCGIGVARPDLDVSRSILSQCLTSKRNGLSPSDPRTPAAYKLLHMEAVRLSDDLLSRLQNLQSKYPSAALRDAIVAVKKVRESDQTVVIRVSKSERCHAQSPRCAKSELDIPRIWEASVKALEATSRRLTICEKILHRTAKMLQVSREAAVRSKRLLMEPRY